MCSILCVPFHGSVEIVLYSTSAYPWVCLDCALFYTCLSTGLLRLCSILLVLIHRSVLYSMRAYPLDVLYSTCAYPRVCFYVCLCIGLFRLCSILLVPDRSFKMCSILRVPIHGSVQIVLYFTRAYPQVYALFYACLSTGLFRLCSILHVPIHGSV